MSAEWNQFDCKIRKMPTDKDDIPQVPAAEAGLIPPHPFSLVVVGRSGQGKSNLVSNLLNNEDFYKDYFDTIVLMAPTGKVDGMLKTLNVDEDMTITDPTPEHLEELFECMREQVEEHESIAEVEKVLLILDDIVSCRKLLNSKEFVKCFCMNRHYNVSVICLTQSYKLLPRSCRIQASAVAFFAGPMEELEMLAECQSIPLLSKKETLQVILKAVEGDGHPFLFINNKAPKGKRYRRNLDECLGY